MLKILIAFLFLYFCILLSAYIFQERLIFFPVKLKADYHFDLTKDDQEITLKAVDGTSINALLFTRPGNEDIIIYFHGNAGSLATWDVVSDELLALNCNVFIIDYRGFGKSGGKFSEEGFYQDAEAAYSYVHSKGYSDKHIFFYGRSLGSGVAVEMALRHEVRGLILETPYTNLKAIAVKRYWYLLPGLLLRYQFDNLRKANQLNIPVLIMHGTNDTVVPVEHSLQLNEVINAPHQLIIIPEGNHTDLDTFPVHRTALRDFLGAN